MKSFILFLLNHLPLCEVINLFLTWMKEVVDDTETDIDDTAYQVLKSSLSFIFPNCDL